MEEGDWIEEFNWWEILPKIKIIPKGFDLEHKDVSIMPDYKMCKTTKTSYLMTG